MSSIPMSMPISWYLFMSYGDSETPLSILVLFCFTIILTMSYHDDTYVDTVAPVGMYTDRDTLLYVLGGLDVFVLVVWLIRKRR